MTSKMEQESLQHDWTNHLHLSMIKMEFLFCRVLQTCWFMQWLWLHWRAVWCKLISLKLNTLQARICFILHLEEWTLLKYRRNCLQNEKYLQCRLGLADFQTCKNYQENSEWDLLFGETNTMDNDSLYGHIHAYKIIRIILQYHYILSCLLLII